MFLVGCYQRPMLRCRATVRVRAKDTSSNMTLFVEQACKAEINCRSCEINQRRGAADSVHNRQARGEARDGREIECGCPAGLVLG